MNHMIILKQLLITSVFAAAQFSHLTCIIQQFRKMQNRNIYWSRPFTFTKNQLPCLQDEAQAFSWHLHEFRVNLFEFFGTSHGFFLKVGGIYSKTRSLHQSLGYILQFTYFSHPKNVCIVSATCWRGNTHLCLTFKRKMVFLFYSVCSCGQICK